MFEIGLTATLFLFLCIQIALLVSLLLLEKTKKGISTTHFPFVSILIAARNEEENIVYCLKSIEFLDYPIESYEVLIGNDSSTDKTSEIVRKFIDGKPNFKLIEITQTLGKARAKANVLANLVKESKGDILFVTDADIEVKSTWIKALIKHFDNAKIGIVSGSTIVRDKGFFSSMQGLDWLYFSGMLVGLDKFGFKSTAVGNNMAFRKSAYLSTGGYENIDFSVTEDFKLFSEIRKQDWQSVNVIEFDSLNFSKSQKSVLDFLHQRKRWMRGAMDLPFEWKIIFGLYALFYPILFVLFFFNPTNAVFICIAKITLQSLIIFHLNFKLKLKNNCFQICLLELFVIFSTVSTMLFFVLPIKMLWKNRIY